MPNVVDNVTNSALSVARFAELDGPIITAVCLALFLGVLYLIIFGFLTKGK